MQLEFETKIDHTRFHIIKKFLKDRNINAEVFFKRTSMYDSDMFIRFATAEDKMTYILTGYENNNEK